MSMLRRQFTKEFKEAAVRRLELGASVGEVARACEVNPNVLHRWKRELRDHGVKALAANVRWAAKRWRSIFCKGACSMSRSSAGWKHRLSAARLPVHRRGNEVGHADYLATPV
jgi:Transposase